MTPSTATESTSSQSESGPRRRSLSGALTRRFTRNSTSTEQRPTPSKSESSTTTKRRATIATSTSTDSTAQVHVRIVPNIENPSRSLIFDIVDRVLTVGSVIRIGRYSERHANLNCMSFKSKVVSRSHCEVWVETDGKVNIN
jgi:pSer/pThr/pTyr-binding forkhead associated (FHA) protein